MSYDVYTIVYAYMLYYSIWNNEICSYYIYQCIAAIIKILLNNETEHSK